jgi:hypothetical protein
LANAACLLLLLPEVVGVRLCYFQMAQRWWLLAVEAASHRRQVQLIQVFQTHHWSQLPENLQTTASIKEGSMETVEAALIRMAAAVPAFMAMACSVASSSVHPTVAWQLFTAALVV